MGLPRKQTNNTKWCGSRVVLRSIPDPNCRAWKLKFTGKESVDPTSLVDDLPIGPQMASEIVSIKPQEVMELVEEELTGKTQKQTNEIKMTIADICRSQALAHRHTADVADHLASLTDMVSLPFVMKVINATMRLTVALKIPEVDDMLERAQEKVNQIRKAKEAAGGIKPIDEVICAQNVPQYNPEWEYSQNSRQTAYLATLVCRYMNEAQWKEKKLVLSAKALEQIYHTASS